MKVPTFLEEMKARVASSELSYAPGCDINSQDESGFEAALLAAKAADVAILVMGGRSGLSPENTTGEFRDATQLGLPGVQDKLVKAILATGKPVVLVLMNGRPVSIPELVEPAGAILEAWVPGEEGARAIVDALFGKINPGGKLPISIPRSAGQVPVFYNHKPSGMHSNIYGDYMDDKVTPLFPFGHGMSYTEFEYSNLKIDQVKVSAGGTVDISLTVKNIGQLAGDEVVQFYVNDEFASMPRPVKELKGYTRLTLEPGTSKQVTFHFPVNQMAFYDADLKLILEPGTFKVMVGSSSETIHLEGQFEVTGKGPVEIKERIFVCPVAVQAGNAV